MKVPSMASRILTTLYKKTIPQVRYFRTSAQALHFSRKTVDSECIMTHSMLPYKLGYSHVWSKDEGSVVSREDPDLLLQYWPMKFRFEIPELESCETEFRTWLDKHDNHWSDEDRLRHKNLISYQTFLSGWQTDKQRRLMTLKLIEVTYVNDDLLEELIVSDDPRKETMGKECATIVRAIMSGHDTPGMSTRYRKAHPKLYFACCENIEMYRELKQEFNQVMSPVLLKAFEKIAYRTYDAVLQEYKLWKTAMAENRHVTLEEFEKIKTSGLFQIITFHNMDEEDIPYLADVGDKKKLLFLGGLLNQASNDLYSFPKENRFHHPFNMIQRALVTDKLPLKQALIVNIQRRNEHMRQAEDIYFNAPSTAQRTFLKGFKTVAAWECYLRHATRYGWTSVQPSNVTR
ncbi:hypothetical protein HDE_01467 [Halotydeus destructor]|nr:hypothetical protein HDE_01467 [Halotydeus destructor]